MTNAGYRPTANTGEFEICINFRDSLADRMATTGIYFSASTATTDSLNGVYIETNLYTWDDAFVDVNGTVSVDLTSAVAFGGYTYDANLQNVPVWSPYTSGPYILLSNQRYLFCAKTFDEKVFLGFGTTTDYDEHINTYLQPVGPINDDGTWFWAGFGTDVVPSIAAKMFDKNTLGNEEVTTISNGRPAYPNPATNMVYIPVTVVTGDMQIAILDMQGRIIKTEVRNITNPGSLPVNIEGVSNGQYIIRLTSHEGATQSFKILINN
jgi:hypothetical protein